MKNYLFCVCNISLYRVIHVNQVNKGHIKPEYIWEISDDVRLYCTLTWRLELFK